MTLKNEFEEFTKQQENNNNILMKDRNFNLNNFNNIFDQNFTTSTKGYGDFMKNGDTTQKNRQLIHTFFLINLTYLYLIKFSILLVKK